MLLPDVSRIDRAIKGAGPLQGATERGAFTTTIKGYTNTQIAAQLRPLFGLIRYFSPVACLP